MSKVKDKWEFYGENDPYFAVSTFDKFKTENINEEIKDEFFQTGEDHFIRVWETVERHFQKGFRPKNALDFGCGVGRLVVPLASRCEQVTGIDISDKMLAEAKLNCQKRNLLNTKFYQTDEFFAANTGDYDFIHSFIVIQHINPDIGEEIITNLIKKLSIGGIGVLHFTYHSPGSDLELKKIKLYRDYPVLYRLKNLIKGIKHEPFIPMYIYNLNNIMAILQKNDCHNCLIKFSDHGWYGTVVYFQKNSEVLY